MFPEKSPRARRPSVVTAAFWCQLTVAALIVVLVAVNLIGDLLFSLTFGDTPSGPPMLEPGVGNTYWAGTFLAVWLGIGAFGLRRGSRVAYWISLAGLVLPLLLVLVASRTTGTSHAYFYSGPIQEGTLVWSHRMALWGELTAVVNPIVSMGALVLAVATVAILVIRASRFARPSL